MTQKWPDTHTEQQAFEAEIAAIEAWWQTPRQAHIQRPYPASSIAALRNIGFPQVYASSIQARKLWRILNEHNRAGTYEITFGATDPLVATQMAQHQQTVYVSGALCGLSQVSWPGEDHADYPWDTVPAVVKRIFNAQLFQDQRQTQLRMRFGEADRAQLENRDHLLPIVADADMGFGSLTSCIKLVRSFVEAGVAMIHIDDLAIGLKKFTTGEGRTVVPTCEYLARLRTARMQFDVMGADTMLLCRCDTDHSEYITSVLDPRDHEYVLGATKDAQPFVQALEEAKEAGIDPPKAKAEWEASAGLMTYDEAVNAQATPEQYAEYIAEVSKQATSVRERKRISKAVLREDVEFDWELPRTPLGQYRWRWSTKAVIERALLAAPLGDVTWSRMDKPNKKDMHDFHAAIRAVYPDRLFAFGYTGAYDFLEAGYTQEEFVSFPSDIAKMGVVWQVQPIWATQGLSMHAREFSGKLKEDGIAGHMRDVAAPAMASMPTDKHGKPTARGGYLADSFFDVVAGFGITGKGSE